MSKSCGLFLLCLGLSLCPTLARSADISEIDRLVKLGQSDSALARADSALQRDSTDLALRLHIADIYRSQGDTAGRIQMLHDALRLAPRSLDVRLVLIEALWEYGLTDSARVFVGRRGETPGRLSLQGYYLEGKFQELAGHPDSAVAAYRRVRDALRRGRLF